MQTTVSVAMAPCSVTTWVMVPPLESIAVTAQSRTSRAPARRAAPAYPATTLSGVQCPSVGEYAAASSPSVLIRGESALASATSMSRLGTPSSFCRAMFFSNASTCSGSLQEEQVADLVQVDLLAEGGLERLERLQAARAELDVDGVGELGAHPAGGLAGGTGAELALLDQDDVR